MAAGDKFPRSSKAQYLVPAGTYPLPLGELGRGVHLMGATAAVTDRSRPGKPHRPVAGPGTRECVGDLVQQNLFDLVVARTFGENPRDRDCLASMVALPESGASVVKTKCPLRVKFVLDQELPSPLRYRCYRHHSRSVSGVGTWRAGYPQRVGSGANSSGIDKSLSNRIQSRFASLTSCALILRWAEEPRV